MGYNLLKLPKNQVYVKEKAPAGPFRRPAGEDRFNDIFVKNSLPFITEIYENEKITNLITELSGAAALSVSGEIGSDRVSLSPGGRGMAAPDPSRPH